MVLSQSTWAHLMSGDVVGSLGVSMRGLGWAVTLLISRLLRLPTVFEKPFLILTAMSVHTPVAALCFCVYSSTIGVITFTIVSYSETSTKH